MVGLVWFGCWVWLLLEGRGCGLVEQKLLPETLTRLLSPFLLHDVGIPMLRQTRSLEVLSDLLTTTVMVRPVGDTVVM